MTLSLAERIGGTALELPSRRDSANRTDTAQDRPTGPACYVGVDPGQKGAIAVLSGSGRILGVFDMPIITRGKRKSVDGRELDAILAMLERPAVIWLEDVAAFKMGVTSAFSFGKGVGAVEALALAHRLPLEYVTPTTWKRSAGLSKDKAASIDAVRRLYPEAALVPPGCRNPSDGRAEAILIARHGWLQAAKLARAAA